MKRVLFGLLATMILAGFLGLAGCPSDDEGAGDDSTPTNGSGTSTPLAPDEDDTGTPTEGDAADTDEVGDEDEAGDTDAAGDEEDSDEGDESEEL